MIIGIVGPIDSGQKIKESLNKISCELEIRLYIGEKVVDTIEVIEKCEEECDAIIFTGCAVEEVVLSKYEVKKPYTFVSRGGTSIVKAFWEIKDAGMGLDRFSIDVVENEVLDDIITEIDINPINVFSLPYSCKIDEMEYVDWHVDLFNQNKIDVMLTGFGAVYNELKKRGYPVFRLKATIPEIKNCYNQVKNKYALSMAQHSQIGVEILTLVDYNDDIDSYYSNMIKKVDLNKLIVNYVKNIQGSIFSFGRDEYVVFSNKGAINTQENYNNLYKLQQDIKKVGFLLSVGIGNGITAYQAEANAHKALKKSVSSKEFNIFLVDENDSIRGPLGSENEINYSLVSSDENTIDIANKTGLSCESVSKIMALSEVRKSKVYDAKELAECLDISERSARRILNKIISVGLGAIYAKETSKGGGRPKNLIEMLF